MKNLYHLLVTSYELRVKLPRFCFAKSPLQNLKGIYCSGVACNAPTHSSHHIEALRATPLLILILLLPFFAFAQKAATITDLNFSCPGTVEVSYELESCNPVDVTLYYSSDKCTWIPAITVENVQPGADKTIIWDAAEDKVSYGRFYFKVTYPSSNHCKGGISVGGICWAPRNVDAPGTFAANPESYGMYYQWNKKVGWSSSDPLTSSPSGATWNNVADSDAEWASANDPCPDGWRVPTETELESLSPTVINPWGPLETYPSTTIDGRWFGDGGEPSLFLPAAGGRYAGNLGNQGELGEYWHNLANIYNMTQGVVLKFGSDDFGFWMTNKNSANSVRCVKRCVMINGICWAETNLDEGGVFCENPWDYGALYQWGRNADGHESRNSANYPCNNTTEPSTVPNGLNHTPLTAANLDSNGQPTGTVDITSATNCPDPAVSVSDKFIKNTVAPNDWRTPQCDTLWNSGTEGCPVKTVNDPCPYGWRVPTRNELATLGVPHTNETYVTKVWQNDYEGTGIKGYLCTDNSSGSSIFLPAAGSKFYNDGLLVLVGMYGFYLSSTPNGTYADVLGFYDIGLKYFDIGDVFRAYSSSVRCVAE